MSHTLSGGLCGMCGMVEGAKPTDIGRTLGCTSYCVALGSSTTWSLSFLVCMMGIIFILTLKTIIELKKMINYVKCLSWKLECSASSVNIFELLNKSIPHLFWH